MQRTWWPEAGTIIVTGLYWVQIGDFLSRVTFKIDRWPLKTIGHLFYTTLSLVLHFKATGIFKLELQSGNAKLGSKLAIFVPRETEIRWITLKNNRAPLLCCFKLCASFHSHWCIQTGVIVWKRPVWVKIGDFFLAVRVTFKFDRWPWKTIGHLF